MESTTKRNPLTSHFRQPAIFIKLPSRGRWWADGALEMPENQELAVYPMSTRDEIILKTPDALLNGQGIVSVIQSCCPGIKNAWAMPGVDVDTVLIAVRIASFGNNMEFDSKCPHCGEENTHEIDLTVPLSQITSPDYSDRVVIQDLSIKLRPQTYFDVNRGNTIAFEEEKLTNALNLPESVPAEEKAKLLEESMARLADYNVQAVAKSIEYIDISSDERVTDQGFIVEYLQNAGGEVVRTIQAKLVEYANQIKIKPVNLQCNDCTKPYSVDLTFDYSSFFGKSS